MKKIILASQSPRRRELLSMLPYRFEVIPSKVKEVIEDGLPPYEIVKSLAYQKGYDVFRDNQDCIVIGSDTIVVVDDTIMGKPKDQKQAREMMQLLRNREHQVITGVAVLSSEKQDVFADISEVYFNDIPDLEIEEYVNTDEAYDKAGGYAIQGWAGKYIRKIEGNYYTIMGMPIDRVYQCLKEYEE